MGNRLRSNLLRHIRLILPLLLVVMTGILVQACAGSDEAELAVGDQAPDFTLPMAGGGNVSLADYREKQPVLLYFHMAKG